MLLSESLRKQVPGNELVSELIGSDIVTVSISLWSKNIHTKERKYTSAILYLLQQADSHHEQRQDVKQYIFVSVHV